MIKIQKEEFNSEEEIQKIKKLHSSVGAVTSFIGYVRDYNNNKNVQSINLEVYEVMGASSYFVKIAAENNEDAQSIIKKIGDIERVSHSESFLVLKELKHQSSRIPVSTIDKPDRKPRKIYE